MIRDEIKQIVSSATAAAQKSGALPPFELPAVEILRPKQADHGDYSTNIAMSSAAAIRKTGGSLNPRAIATAVAAQMPVNGMISRVEVAGPGFINLWLADDWLQRQVIAAALAGPAFGNIDRGRGQRWQVEFVSANPTGPVHYGGARNAALGDSLANVLTAAGYSVQREFYVNDAGNQFNAFAGSLFARYCQLFGRDEPIPEDGYVGDYMIDYAQIVRTKHGDLFLHMARDAAIAALKPIGEEIVLASLARELASMNVRFDRWFREQSLYDDGLVNQVLARLRAQGDIVDRDGASWFLASNYLDKAKDEVVVRSNGIPTYFASDIAYHYDKFVRRGFDQVVNIWAVDHQGHFPRMATVMQALGLAPARLTILLYNLVKLVRDGQEVKLSKRKGNLLTIGDVVEEVGADAVRFNLLSRGPESTIEFDLDLAIATTNDNPVYYVQYGHARICSILAKAAGSGFDIGAGAAADLTAEVTATPVALLVHPAELTLIRKLLELEEQIDLAVDKLSPHNLTQYAVDLAKAFSAFYRDCRVVDVDEPALSRARLLLCRVAQLGLAKSLSLIGVTAPESM